MVTFISAKVWIVSTLATFLKDVVFFLSGFGGDWFSKHAPIPEKVEMLYDNGV